VPERPKYVSYRTAVPGFLKLSIANLNVEVPERYTRWRDDTQDGGMRVYKKRQLCASYKVTVRVYTHSAHYNTIFTE
jgi:hypothetical protein